MQLFKLTDKQEEILRNVVENTRFSKEQVMTFAGACGFNLLESLSENFYSLDWKEWEDMFFSPDGVNPPEQYPFVVKGN